MLPFEVILKAMIILHCHTKNTDSKAPTYNTHVKTMTQFWSEYASLDKSSPRRKRHNICANIHQDESSSLYSDTTSVRACITTRRHVNKHGRRKYNFRATPEVPTFLIPIVMTTGKKTISKLTFLDIHVLVSLPEKLIGKSHRPQNTHS